MTLKKTHLFVGALACVLLFVLAPAFIIHSLSARIVDLEQQVNATTNVLLNHKDFITLFKKELPPQNTAKLIVGLATLVGRHEDALLTFGSVIADVNEGTENFLEIVFATLEDIKKAKLDIEETCSILAGSQIKLQRKTDYIYNHMLYIERNMTPTKAQVGTPEVSIDLELPKGKYSVR